MTRSPVALELPAARMHVDVDVLTAADLALTVDETAIVLGVEGEQALLAHGATGGSPMGVRLLALSAGLPERDARRTLEDVVTTAVDRLDRSTAAFVRATSTAELLTSDLAATLAGTTAAAARDLLDEVTTLGLGAWGDAARCVFVYPPVVREALRARLRRDDVAAFRELRAQVAAWCATHDRPVEALQAAVDTDDLDLVAAVARQYWHVFLLETVGAVRVALQPVSPSRLRRHPLLLFLLALSHDADPAGRARAVALFALAAGSARAERERVPAADRLLLRTIEVVALRLTGHGHAAARAAADVVRRADDLTESERVRVADLLPHAYASAGTAFLYVARTEQAVHAFERGLAAVGAPADELANLALLAGTLALDGAMCRARRHVERVRRGPWPPGFVEGRAGECYHVAEALLAIEDLDGTRAQAYLGVLVPHQATIEHWPLVAYAQAHADLLRDGAETALARLEDTVRAHTRHQSPHRSTVAALDATRATLLVAAGRPLAALELLPDTSDDPLRVVATARAHLAAGRPEAALAALARVSTVRRGTLRSQADRALLEATVLLALDRSDDAVAALRRAQALLTVHGLRLPLALLPADARAALGGLAREHGLVAAAELLGRPSPAVAAAPGDVPSLTRRETVVLHALARTGSSRQIAAELVVSPHTVKSQLRTLYRKLGATSRPLALAEAGRLGLLPDHDRDARY